METKRGKVGSAATGGALGTASGIGGSGMAVSSAGSVAGLSASGFTSELATIGGGSMIVGGAILLTGVAVLALGGAYGGYKLYQYFVNPKSNSIIINSHHVKESNGRNASRRSRKSLKSRRRFYKLSKRKAPQPQDQQGAISDTLGLREHL